VVHDSSGPNPTAAITMRRMHLLGAGTPLTRFEILRPSAPKISSAPSATTGHILTLSVHNSANTTLSFNFGAGYSSDQITTLSTFLRLNYGTMVTVYGDPCPPQQGQTVQVIGNSYQAAYSPPLTSASGGGTLYYSYQASASSEVNDYNFCVLALAAFHGPEVFAFDYVNGLYVDAWETGFTEAAALEVVYLAAGSPSTFDPSQLGVYVSPVYDLFNRPELGNAYFFPQTGSVGVSFFRVAMAQAAWMKVMAEDTTFFAQFNTAYYAGWTASVAANVDGLKAIAAGIVPTVEAQNFDDWYRRQYVLDTSVTTGEKLYLAILPLPNATSGDTRSGFQGYAQAFSTDAQGEETAIDTLASVDVTDDTGADVTDLSSELSASNIISLGGGSTPTPGQAIFGAGFSTLGTINQARLAVTVSTGLTTATSYFPYNVAGTTASGALYYGAVIGANSGPLQFSVIGTSGTNNTTVARGAWTGGVTYPSALGVRTKFTFNGVTIQRNTSWLVPGSNAVGVGLLFQVPPANNTFAMNLASGTSNVRMMSVPLYPTLSDEAQILGVSPTTLQLARYRPNLSPGTFTNGALEFGIGGDRHELYPNISSPMGPGEGYWLGVNGSFSATVKGGEPPHTAPFSVPLLGGWNQIGVPFDLDFSPANIEVQYGGFAPASLADAMSRGWIMPGIWRWQASGGYERVDVAGAVMAPFDGFYVYTPYANGVSLIFDPSLGTSATAVAASITKPGIPIVPILATTTTGTGHLGGASTVMTLGTVAGTGAGAGDWTVNLVVARSGNTDAGNIFGIAPDRIPAAKPPTGESALTMHFLSSGSNVADAGGAGKASGWADSFDSGLTNRLASWYFTVDGLNKSVTWFTWPSLQSVPSTLKLYLVDLANGNVTIMREGGYYAFQPNGTPRSFRIDAFQVALPKVAVKLIPASGIAQITLTDNVAFGGRLQIRDGYGVTMATLASGTLPDGVSTWSWNGTNYAGQHVPPAWYEVVVAQSNPYDYSAVLPFQFP